MSGVPGFTFMAEVYWGREWDMRYRATYQSVPRDSEAILFHTQLQRKF